jgi:hypothetical protein
VERPPGAAREVDVDGLARLLDELVGVDHADGVELRPSAVDPPLSARAPFQRPPTFPRSTTLAMASCCSSVATAGSRSVVRE